METFYFLLVWAAIIAMYGHTSLTPRQPVYRDKDGYYVNMKRHVRMTVKGDGIPEKNLKGGDEVLVRKLDKRFTVNDVKVGDMVMMTDGGVRLVKNVGDCTCRWDENRTVGVVKYKI